VRSRLLARLALVGLVVLLTLMPAGAVWAVPPVQETWQFDFTWLFEDCGDFEVWEHFYGDVRATHYYDQDGNPIRTVFHATGTGMVYNNSDPDIWLQEEIVHNVGFFDENGDQVWAAGRMVHIVLPGEGLIFIAAGRVFECEGAICWGVAGHNDWIEGDKDALCSALSGS
jgi:hypothetical protein